LGTRQLAKVKPTWKKATRGKGTRKGKKGIKSPMNPGTRSFWPFFPVNLPNPKESLWLGKRAWK